MADPMTREAIERIAHYVSERRTMRGLDPDVVHAVHSPLGEPRHAELRLSDLDAVLAALRAAPPDDGSVLVRVDPVYAEKMRGEGLVGPFSRILLDERDGVPTLFLVAQPTPTPDTVEWWRSVAQELATEIHKMRGVVAAPPADTGAPPALVAQPFEPPMGVCQWLDEGSDYTTECGHGWQFMDGGVELNDAKFCLFCGGKIQVVGRTPAAPTGDIEKPPLFDEIDTSGYDYSGGGR